jgi:hypothetical protein
MPKLTVVILTKNEEKNIAECIESVSWADEVLVLDGGSTDKTVDIAKGLGCRVVERPFRGFADQRNAALDLVENEWVFFIDADERVTPELASEVRRVICEGGKEGWWVPRHNYIFGRLTLHAGWYPDYQLRIMKRGKAHYDPTREVHEIVILEGESGYLENPLIHYNYDSLSQFVKRQDFYTDYEAEILFKQGIRPKPHNFILQPLRHFSWRYFTLKGYKDGLHGLLLSLLMAYYNLVMYIRLGRLWIKMKGGSNEKNNQT